MRGRRARREHDVHFWERAIPELRKIDVGIRRPRAPRLFLRSVNRLDRQLAAEERNLAQREAR
jgi:hypothetical protein